MPNRSKKLIRIISIGLVTALFAGVVLGTQTKVVQAADAFLEVQRDWTSSSTEQTKSFTILEVVDKKSEFGEGTDGNASITLGEEEIGYLIGGAEPFYNKYQELVNLSKEYSKTKEKQEDQAKVKAYYDALLEKVQAQITSYNDDATVNVLAPLSLMEATSFQPTLAGYENCLRLLENVSSRGNDSITAGFMVEDPNGVYIVSAVDSSSRPTAFTFAGEPTTARMMFKVMRPRKNAVEESISDNSVSDNSVSGNSVSDNNNGSITTTTDTNGEMRTETTEGENLTPKDPTDNVEPESPTTENDDTQEGNENQGGDEGNETPTSTDNNINNSDSSNGDNEDEVIKQTNSSNGDNEDEVIKQTNSSNGDNEDEVIKQTNSSNGDNEDEVIEQTNPSNTIPVEPTGTPETELQEEPASIVEDGDEVSASLRYKREVFFGKQVVLMSSVGELNNSSVSTEPSDPQEPTLGTEGSVEVPDIRYSFYQDESSIPDALKDKKIQVAVSDSAAPGIIDEGTGTGTTNSVAQIDAIYQYRFVGIQNNEWFKTYVFGLDSNTLDNLVINVVTCTPAELTETVINGGDLIYWNSKEAALTASDVNSDGKDLTATNAIALLNRITGPDSIPCIINHSSYSTLNPVTNGNGANSVSRVNNNVNKMLHLLYQKEIEETYKKAEYGFSAATNWWIDIVDENPNTNTIWEQINSTVTILNAGHFVRDNVYVINHAINAVTYSDSNSNIALNGIKDKVNGNEQEIAVAFDEVAYRIEREIYERQNTSGVNSWNDTTITPALAIQTILTYSKTPAVIEKSHITVLELQPCYSFTYVNDVEAFKTKFLPENSSVEIEIVGMTTSEFCGKIEDINVKYDMIYIGSNTDLMNRIEVTDDDYCTAYNDFKMYGVVYAHTGDLCHIGSHTGTLAANEMNTYRYSGNDILEAQVVDLMGFLQSGAPIVVADDFFVKETVDTTTEIVKISSGSLNTTVDDTARGTTATGITRNGILDSSSYIYQFVKNACVNAIDSDGDGNLNDIQYGDINWNWNTRKYKNFLTVSEVEKASFSQWLNQPKMSIHMLSQPTEYNYTTKRVGISNVIDDSSFLQKEGDYYYLSYEFYISSIASVDIQNTRYKASLWIDTNMDGKFSDNTENLTDSELVIKNMDTGDIVDRDSLKSGIHYQIRRKLPTEIVGAVPWKLEIKHAQNSALRNAATGITAVRVPEKQNIRVLQLYQGAANIQTYMQQENNHWNALLHNVPDFEVEVTSIEATKYFDGSEDVELDNYDMLIVGFADYYQGGTGFSKEVLDDIIDYAESGKCVLFSHDNTNWQNGSANSLNTYIRDISGLDRYGVSVYRNKDASLFEKNYIKNGSDIAKDTKTELKNHLFGSDEMQNYKRDIAFKVNSNQTIMDSRTQGLSYSGNEHDRVSISSKSDGIKDKNGVTYGDYYRYLKFDNAPQGTWINQNNHVIEKVNVGAITEYPYRLSNTMKVASTHGQYFQLDLDSDKDGDGEGDIVVWYTLNDSVEGNLNDIYDYSPNDVRNNYYIYNRGNITYTGMGHSNIKDNEEEVKLFINTMIAAYRVAMQSPTLNIIEGNGDNTDKSFDAIPFDGNVSNNATTYNVYFKAEDVNLISESQKNIRCKIYIGGGSEVINVDEENINVTHKSGQATGGWRIFDTATNAEVAPIYDNQKNEFYYPITSGREYYLQVPLVEPGANGNGVVNLSETKSLDLYIEVQSFITKNNKVNESALIYDNFKLTQINLFDLD